MLAQLGGRVSAALTSSEVDALRRRVRPDVWSALEYACHVRDVLLVQRERLYLALVEDTPDFARMYRDERVILARYNEQDADEVADQLTAATRLAAQAFAGLDEKQWRRRLIYNYPGPVGHDVAWLAAHTVHEIRHHLGDITAVLSGQAPSVSC